MIIGSVSHKKLCVHSTHLICAVSSKKSGCAPSFTNPSLTPLPRSTSSNGFNLYNDSEESQMDSNQHLHANIFKNVFCSSFWLVVEHNLAYCEHLAESLLNHFLIVDHSTKEEMRVSYAVAY